MKTRRLGWAGIEIESGGETAVVDLRQDIFALPVPRSPNDPLPPPSWRARLGTSTHIQANHADPNSIAGPLLRPKVAEGMRNDVVWRERA